MAELRGRGLTFPHKVQGGVRGSKLLLARRSMPVWREGWQRPVRAVVQKGMGPSLEDQPQAEGAPENAWSKRLKAAGTSR